MMKLSSPIPDEVLGALIGLARATYNTVQPTEPAYRLMVRLLAQSLTDAPDYTTALDTLHAEKVRVSPDCAACGAPCGRTADFDLRALAGQDARVVAMKGLILSGLRTLARDMQQNALPTGDEGELLSLFADALFCLGEDWTVDELMTIALEVGGG